MTVNTTYQTTEQAKSLLHEIFSHSHRKGCVYDGITAARFIMKEFGLNYDWHIISDMFDYWTRIGMAERLPNQDSGYTKYIIN